MRAPAANTSPRGADPPTKSARHYAGTKSNLTLAQYELGEIQEGLDDALKYYLHFQDVSAPLTELVPTMTKGSLAQVSTAIEQKNEKEFVKAFDSPCVSLLELPPGGESPVCEDSASDGSDVQQSEIRALTCGRQD
jgi:hypothetical protein